MRAAAAVAAVALTALAGCATEAGLRKRLEPTLGQNEAALVNYVGRPPDQIYYPDKNAGPGGVTNAAGNAVTVKFLAWSMSSAGTLPGYWQCSYGYCSVQPPTTYVNQCTLIFQLHDGVVKSYRYHGNACAA